MSRDWLQIFASTFSRKIQIMIISHKHRFICFAPAKTASSSIRRMAREEYHAFVYCFHNKSDEVIPESPSPTCHAHGCKHLFFLPKQFEDYFTFLLVRNPYDRFYSAYNFWTKFDDPEQLFDYKWTVPITQQISNPNKLNEPCVPIRIDAIVRTEQLEKNFNNLPFVKTPVSIPTFNVSEKRDIKFTPELIEKIKSRYLLDFSMFGYDKDDHSSLPK